MTRSRPNSQPQTRSQLRPQSPKFQYRSSMFSFSGRQTKAGWCFRCLVDATSVNTKLMPATISILQRTVPGVFQTECFNDAHVPFRQEAEKTEIGHLFEHILIHLLLDSQVKNGQLAAVYEGRTSWNWVKHPVGSFSINIWGPLVHTELFQTVLNNTTAIIEEILLSAHQEAPATSVSV